MTVWTHRDFILNLTRQNIYSADWCHCPWCWNTVLLGALREKMSTFFYVCICLKVFQIFHTAACKLLKKRSPFWEHWTGGGHIWKLTFAVYSKITELSTTWVNVTLWTQPRGQLKKRLCNWGSLWEKIIAILE